MVFSEGVGNGDGENGKTLMCVQECNTPDRPQRLFKAGCAGVMSHLWPLETLGRPEPKPGAVHEGVFCQQLPTASLPDPELE